jgi:hypothetical protein
MSLPSKEVLLQAYNNALITIASNGEWCKSVNDEEAYILKIKNNIPTAVIVNRSDEFQFRCIKEKSSHAKFNQL